MGIIGALIVVECDSGIALLCVGTISPEFGIEGGSTCTYWALKLGLNC